MLYWVPSKQTIYSIGVIPYLTQGRSYILFIQLLRHFHMFLRHCVNNCLVCVYHLDNSRQTYLHKVQVSVVLQLFMLLGMLIPFYQTAFTFTIVGYPWPNHYQHTYYVCYMLIYRRHPTMTCTRKVKHVFHIYDTRLALYILLLLSWLLFSVVWCFISCCVPVNCSLCE